MPVIVSILLVNCLTAETLLAHVGVKVGMSSSILSIPDNEGRPFLGYETEWLIWHRLTGVQLGIFKEFDVAEHLGIQAEILYARRGMDASTGFLFDDVDYKIKLDYIEIPAECKLRLPLSDATAIGILAGPYFAVNVGARRQSRIDGAWQRITLKNVRTFDYGLVAGVCSDIVIRNRTLVLEFRRAPDSHTAPVQHMGIDHGGSYVLVPEELLDCSNVIAVLKQVCCEGVP